LVAGPARSCFRTAPGVMRVWMASAVVLAVGLTVLTVPMLTVPGFPRMVTVPAVPFGDLVTAALLVAGSVLTVEMGRFFEGRVRVGQRPHKGLSGWAMATVILLPQFWVLPVMVGVYAHARWRGMRVPLWKWVGSAAFLVLAGLAAGRVLRIGPPDDPVGLHSGATGVLLVVAAVLVFLAVESALLFGSARLCDESDERWLRRTLADPGFYFTEAAVLALGAVTGLLGAAAPWFVLLLVPGHVMMQQAVLHRPLQDQAAVDSKTGLLRYEPWCRMAGDELARHGSTGRPWSVLFADLDHFKAFNDRLGHLTGDRALAVVAAVLRETLRGHDLIARFGGEEFCIFLPGTSAEQAAAVAERIRLRVKSLGPPELGAPLTISIGVAAVDAEQPDPSLLEALSRADRALYQAKLDGRDTVRQAATSSSGAGERRRPVVPTRGRALPRYRRVPPGRRTVRS